jgi:hypothetical protein
VSGETALELYVFVLIAAAVFWLLEVLWLVVGRRVWRWVWRRARRGEVVDAAGALMADDRALDDLQHRRPQTNPNNVKVGPPSGKFPESPWSRG